MTANITDLFCDSSEALPTGSPVCAKRILNYVWISAKKQEETDNPEHPEHPMPQKYSDNISYTSKANPDVTLLLWVDNDLLNSSHRLFLDNLACAHPNLSIRDLNEIPEYRDNPLFRKMEQLPTDSCSAIWQKVDLARIVVLDHLLANEDADEIYYSDLDIMGLRISSDSVQSAINRHNMVFAKCDRNGRNTYAYLENQFMGFRKEAAAFVSDQLLPATQADINKGENGWLALCRCVKKQFAAIDSTLDTATIMTREIDGPNSMGWLNAGGNSQPVSFPSAIALNNSSVIVPAIGEKIIDWTNNTAFGLFKRHM